MMERTNTLQEPRQFVPPEGHSFTSMKRISAKHKNRFETDPVDPRVISIFSEPQFAIGQRAVLIQTSNGNILWDCISLLDQETIDFIKSRGGLKAIAISHPHFYSSHLQWAREFECPVYLAREDEEWVNRVDVEGRRIFIGTPTLEILLGATFVKLGGHFPGSSMLHWSNKIFVRGVSEWT
jgi:glyoxylase-like metal-dependent hydrolase (beta-lactamase superfamily II)